MKFEGIFLCGMWIPCRFVGPIHEDGTIDMEIDWPRHFREMAARKGVEVAD